MINIEEKDQNALSRMLERLRSVAHRAAVLPKELAPMSLSFREIDGRGHRIVLANLAAVAGAGPFHVVAFFGERREDVDAEPLYGVDSELIDQFRGHAGIVSYSSLDIGPGASANLVLVQGDGAADQWMKSPRHGYVARELAPRHYRAVRIHRGRLEGAICSAALSLVSTRSIQYEAA